jgi:uncharacterized membrane protein
MSVVTRFLLAITLAVVVVLLVFSATVYGDLPASIPTHFNAAGIPDDFSPRTNWWFLPAICVASTALIVGVTVQIPNRPDLLNVPSKPAILALPFAAQQAVVRQAQPGLMLIGLLTAGLFLYLQYASWQVAQGPAGAAIGSVVLIVPIVSIALIPAILLPVRGELRRQQAALARRQWPET